jgi:hypothetical protein
MRAKGVKVAFAFSACRRRLRAPARDNTRKTPAKKARSRVAHAYRPVSRGIGHRMAPNTTLTFSMPGSLCACGQGGAVRKTPDTQTTAHPVQLGDDTMNNARKPLTALVALSAALALPMAFAQEAVTEPQDPTTTHDPAPQEYTTPEATPAPEAATSQALTWADVDADGDGRLSRDEAANVPALAQVFDDADADGDGFLTQEEYRAYASQADSTAPSPTDGGGDD